MKRIEDPRLIKGIGTYVDDVRLPGIVHTAILRSPHAHARIRKIDVSAARALPGVVAVLTGADVNASCGTVPCAAAIPDLKAPKHTVLAGDRVYFVGHPVAVAIAPDPYIARDAVELIDVDYDPLPVVTDPVAAIKPGSPLTHPDIPSNIAYTHVVAGGSDIDQAFNGADRIIKHKIYLQLLTPAIPTLTGLVLTGCYKIPAVKMEIVGVYTNKMATDAYRGAGRPEATYLIERLMDVVANELGIDRLAIRLKHFPQPTEFPFATSCGLI